MASKPNPVLDYERKRRFPWWNLVGLCGLIAFPLTLVALFLFSDSENTAAYMFECSFFFVVAVGIWGGIKYGEQKNKFWT